MRLATVKEPGFGDDDLIAKFQYDDNGNRTELKYYRQGNESGTTTTISYTYGSCGCGCSNYLTEFSTAGGPTFSFDATSEGDIDGLGRLRYASETLAKVGQGAGTVSHDLTYTYDMLSRLTYAQTTNVFPEPNPHLEFDHSFDDAGNMTQMIYNKGSGNVTRTYGLDHDMVDNYVEGATTKSVDWDENGRQYSQPIDSAQWPDYELAYTWDNRLRYGEDGGDTRTMEAWYTPDGARIAKKRTWDDNSDYNHKYVVDVVRGVPVVLLVLNADSGNAMVNSYIHANGQVLAQHDETDQENRPIYFYLHDRLGSVRQVIDDNAEVVHCYTYDPWGLTVGAESEETAGKSNLYRFAGYVWDPEVSQYYCNARQYDPVLARFTSRDPLQGNFKEPMTLHRYLYALNDPINRTDPSGAQAQEVWSLLRHHYRTVHALSLYYTFLDALLSSTGDPADILNWLPNLNHYREYLFDPENLNKPFMWETEIYEVLDRGREEFVDSVRRARERIDRLGEIIANACDWGDLALCAAPVLLEAGVTTTIQAALLPQALGFCAACAIDPEPVSKTISCVGCGAYFGWKFYSAVKFGYDMGMCIIENCGD
jgi:RHS repeat-associated protein